MPPRRWISVAVPVVCFTAFVIWLVLQFSRGDLDRGDKLASIVSMSVTIITLPLSVFAIVITVRQSQPVAPAVGLPERLDALAEALAMAVRAQWEAEEQVRRIHDPFPLPARWTAASEHLMDHWQNIYGDPRRSDPIELDGHGDHIVDTFNRIPSGRLVVLGRAGAGKTILTSRFVLTLLANRPVPVPVIFSLGSWDPTQHILRDWLTDQLATTYPILAERDSAGTTVAEHMLTTGRIMPVLDGFDEISAGLRGDAINAINAGLRPGDRLLLTSRPEEYAVAVGEGDVLTAAAVVRLEDLTIVDLSLYLRLTTRKIDVHSGRTKWAPVLEHLHAEPGSPLAQVLSTPLMVALARAVFSDTKADPAELLGVTTPAEVEERLLAGFVPAVYSGSRDVGADDAGRWLEFLAAHLDRLGTNDLAWWQLVRAVPRLVVGLVASFVIALVICLVGGVPALLGPWPSDALAGWLAATSVGALALSPLGGAIIGLSRGMRPSPARMRLRLAGRLGHVRRELARGLRSWRTMVWFGAWSLGGAMFGLAAFLFVQSADGIAVGLAAGLIAGVGIWLMITVIRALETPVDPTRTVSPAELLRTDRDTSLRQGFLLGIAGGAVYWLVVLFAFEPAFGYPFGVVFAGGVWLLGWLMAVACGIPLWLLCVSAWGPWLIASAWLALTRRLPWSVMAFLADAHRRGVLRQAGGVYQFRHARLQDHLAAAGGYRRGHASTPEG
ncbi:MAG TPA: NACHT domain-containing protein [Actinophytocola sp.]|nr:NACHT domain-containing protein [Actinophytocola sp.]HEV2783005.1 NACHT domain-containing protein [Actinophytocola sp.]